MVNKGSRTRKQSQKAHSQHVNYVERMTDRGRRSRKIVVQNSLPPSARSSPSKRQTPIIPSTGPTSHRDFSPPEWTDIPRLKGLVRLFISPLRSALISHIANHQSQNDYLRQWMLKCQDYLRCILKAEAPPNPRTCTGVCKNEGIWKCLECLGQPVLCPSCC